MTRSQRETYLLMCQAGREREATDFRVKCEEAIARADANTYYLDKHEHKISAGMMIRIGDDEPEEVLLCGDDNLGINASKPAYLKAHPDAPEECYPLSEFPRADIEIVGYPAI